MIPIPRHIADDDPRLATLRSEIKLAELETSEEIASCLFWMVGDLSARGRAATMELWRSARDDKLIFTFDGLAAAAGIDSDALFSLFVGCIRTYAPKIKAVQARVLH